MSTLGNRLKELRASDGRTQDAISAELKKYDIKADRVTVARWENDIQQPTLRPVKALADIYGVSTDYIIDGSDTHNSISSRKQQIPVYARISADFEQGSEREIIGWEFVRTDRSGNAEGRFGFIVTGDSMHPKYMDGDIVIVSSVSEIPDGKDVLVSVGNSDAVIRKAIYLDNGSLLLQPYNQAYPSASYTPDDIAELPVMIRAVTSEIRRRL